jgi:hypothetical protein
MYKSVKIAFDSGSAERRNHPLPQGSSYKLREAYCTWDERLDALFTIEAYLRSETPIPPHLELNGWMGFEWKDELRKLPENFARDMGWRILPAVKVLCEPAEPSADREKIASAADQYAEQLVTFSGKLKRQISNEGGGKNAALERIAAARCLINSTRAWMEDAFWAANVPQSAYRQS